MRRSIISPLLHFLATSARKSEPSTAWTFYSGIIVSVIPASNHLQAGRPVSSLSSTTEAQIHHDTRRLAILLDHDSVPTCGPRFIKISHRDSLNINPTKKQQQNPPPPTYDEENIVFQHLGRRCLDLDFFSPHYTPYTPKT